MSWLEISALALAFVAGAAAGSYATYWSLLDMVMRIDDALTEKGERRL